VRHLVNGSCAAPTELLPGCATWSVVGSRHLLSSCPSAPPGQWLVRGTYWAPARVRHLVSGRCAAPTELLPECATWSLVGARHLL